MASQRELLTCAEVHWCGAIQIIWGSEVPVWDGGVAAAAPSDVCDVVEADVFGGTVVRYFVVHETAQT